MSAPVGIGIVGYGGMARYHARRMGNLPDDLRVVGAYDTDPAQQKAAQQAGYIAYPSAEALLSDDAVQAVLIATPNHVHKSYAVAAAKAGKHILCEKPVTLCCADLDEMERAARENGVLFTVHQNRRWDSDYIAARTIFRSGRLGKVTRIDSFVCGANGIPGGWRKLPSAGGGMLLDWGVHLIDQIADGFGAHPKSLYCRFSHALGFDVDDGFDAQLEFADDLTVHVRVDTNTFSPLPRWRLYGRDGTATVADWDVNGNILLPVYGKEVEIVGIEAGNGFTKTMAYRPHESVRELPVPKPTVDGDEFYKNFAASVRKEAQPLVTIASVRNVLRLLELCVRSDRENAVLTLDEEMQRCRSRSEPSARGQSKKGAT